MLCSVYLPPHSCSTHSLDLCNYLSDLSGNNKVIILGDFNFPSINWQTLLGTSETSSLFCDFVYDNNLDQLVTEPTHVKGNILDLILTNVSDNIQDVSVYSRKIPLSTDNFIISCSIQVTTRSQAKANCYYVYNFSKADFAGLVSHLLDYKFDYCLSSSDMEFVWSYI